MPESSQNKRSELDFLFHPESIAVAGVSSVSGDPNSFSAGRIFVQNLINAGFKGKIYPVNPNGGEISGLKIYRSFNDIPGKVDYVMSSIPARHSLQLVKDCARKGAKAIHFFTSGFSELDDDDEGGKLEAQIVEVAAKNGIRLIGPNCMGIYRPSTGLSFGRDFPKKNGAISLIAQSGGNTVRCIWEGTTRGMYFNKVISYGNAADLNETDLLEYFITDPESKLIAAYIEGVKDGARFARVLKKACRAKPVIIFKAGATETGTRTAASHTGAMTGSNNIWNSLLVQAGAIHVNSIEEIFDVALLLLRVPLPGGKNVAVIGTGGGSSVKDADDCSNAGLTLPSLPERVRQGLREIYKTSAGHIFTNPVDIEPFGSGGTLVDVFKKVAESDEVDFIIIRVEFDLWCLISKKIATDLFINSIINTGNTAGKPIAVVLHSVTTDEARQLAAEAQKKLIKAGFPVFPSMERAALAINRFVEYGHRIATAGDKIK